MIKPVITHPNQILRAKSTPVKKIDRETLKLITDLEDTLKTATNPEGMGLSAPQIGINKRVILVRKIGKDRQHPGQIKSSLFLMINPKITNTSTKLKKSFEGCLSVPKTYGWVNRSPKIKIKYLNNEGKECTLSARDLFAFVIQHEIDHLDGILFIDKNIGRLYSEEEVDKMNS